MNKRQPSDKLAALVVAVLLVLAAWGNAVVMLVVSALGLAACVLFYRKGMSRGGGLAATVGLALTVVIALIALLR